MIVVGTNVVAYLLLPGPLTVKAELVKLNVAGSPATRFWTTAGKSA